ncbi:MAG: M55 family metallopeptidase [Gemmatimonadota bacterium]
MMIRLAHRGLAIFTLLLAFPLVSAAQEQPLKLFISVDMEGIGGIGTGQLVNSSGKDYSLGRQLMTAEVNTVVAAAFDAGATEIVVNDSHGDMQNLLHTELDPRVTYIQGAIKPYGMVEGLDETFGGAIFIGYHTRAGTPNGFLAHTGSGAVKGLWIDGRESGEGDMNAAFAASMGVPVLLVSGDSATIEQLAYLGAEGVTTKVAVTPQSARLLHPEVVRARLAEATYRAVEAAGALSPAPSYAPVEVRMRFSDVTTPQILEGIPGVRQVDGYTVEFEADTMAAAYRMIRLMYRFVSV